MWFKLLRENSDMAQLPANALTNILQSLMGRRAHLGEKSIAYVECRMSCRGDVTAADLVQMISALVDIRL